MSASPTQKILREEEDYSSVPRNACSWINVVVRIFLIVLKYVGKFPAWRVHKCGYVL